jgi:hypothetical protein
MEFEAPLFSNAAERTLFYRNVIEAFEMANSHVELICIYEELEPTFEKMKKGTEMDQLSLENLNIRYQAFHVRIEEREMMEAEYATKM